MSFKKHGSVNWYKHFGKILAALIKIKYKYNPAIFFLATYPVEELLVPSRGTHESAHTSFTHNNPKLQITQQSPTE